MSEERILRGVRLSTRVALFTAGIVLLSGGLTAAVIHHYFNRHLVEDALAGLQHRAVMAAGDLEDALEELERDMHVLVASPELPEILERRFEAAGEWREEMGEIFHGLLKVHRTYREVVLFTDDGGPLLAVWREGLGPAAAFETLLPEVAAGGRRLRMVPSGDGGAARLEMLMGAKVPGPAGAAGLLVITLDLEAVFERMSRHLGSEQQMVLLDDAGHILAATAGMTGGSPELARLGIPGGSEGVVGPIASLELGRGGGRLEVGLRRLAPVPDEVVTVAVLTPRQRVVAEAAAMRILIGIILLVILPPLVLLGWLLARRTLRPLEEVAVSVAAFARDGTELPLPAAAGGEVGVLARAFAEMRTRVAARTREAADRRAARLLRSAGVGVLGFDAEGRLTFANPRALELLGYREEELIGQDVHERIHHSHPDGNPYPGELCPMRLAALDGTVREVADEVLWRKDGEAFPVDYTAVPVADGENNEGGVVTFMDVSARNRTEAELREAKEAAERASRAKSEFLANMSHELRTPMHAVLGYAQLMASDSRLPPRHREEAGEILTAGRHLLELIDDVLDLSKVEAGRLELERLHFDPWALAEEVAHTYAPAAEAKGLVFHLELEPEARRPVVGDPTRLRQVLVNLLGNAIKFTEVGEVWLRLHGGAGDELRFEVEDTGIGIDEEARRRLFRPFTQADESTTRRFGGTGLGLALSRRLVEAMGGALELESEPLRGSLFRLRLALPSAATEGGQGGAESWSAAAGAGHGEEGSVHHCYGQVLVVEDNPVNRRLALGMLGRYGIDPDSAENGEEALLWLERSEYDLVLMDVQMPVMDGYEAVRRLRERERERGLRHTTVVAMTANAMVGDRDKALAAGMDDYLPKPVQLARLGALLRKWLPQEGESAEPAVDPAVAAPAGDGALPARLDPQALANLRAGLQGVPGGVEGLIRLYLEEAPKLLEEVAAGLAAADAERVTRAAHSLKSQSAAVGAMALSERCRELEMHGRSDGLAGADELLREAEAAWGAVRPALAELAGDGQPLP